jgi:hypothetical protein
MELVGRRETRVTANSVSIKSGRLAWVFVLVALAALSAIFMWRGAEKAMRMRPQAASQFEFAQLKPEEAAKVVVEVLEASEGKIRGRLLDRQDDTHYTRTQNEARIRWGASAAIVMGKAGDVHPGAILHVTGTVTSDHGLQARQIVILTGYVQVK